jgi:two-component system, chemotaxis family, chemotaxis protein CheY
MQLRLLKIAVVDDDQIYQFIINRTISNLYPESKILNFSNGADFFNFLKRDTTTAEQLPDLVLMDLNTPFMTAWDFLKSYEDIAASLEKQPAIYLVTSSIDPQDEAGANENPRVSGFFSKPLKPEDLMEILDKAAIRA